MTTGFVGLGQMGALMAKRLIADGVIVYDVVPEATASLAEAGAKPAQSLEELAGADLISLMVRDDAQVRDVCGVLLPLVAPGTVIAIHSTIQASTAVELAEQAAVRGIEIVDAPVSGGFMGATEGTLAVMIGGSQAAFERCEGPFGRWASLVLHMGPVGSGTRTKLARNLLHFVAFTAAGEAARLAEASGVSLRKLGRVVRHSDAVTGGPGAIMIRSTATPIPSDDPLRGPFEHALALGDKDLSLAIALADELDVDVPLARLAIENFARSLGVADE
ncbi:NAD(P)-dependent oxidoreductase [Actinocorallia longicatena]|uniref:NAD(P)-dependent oxidoreductase n=1 Tax=Actinocorallia longicatena TaxID=111803 RepID=A0ABP6Q9N3_9ACTN